MTNDSSVTRTRLYRDGKLDQLDFPLDQVSEALAEEATMVWVDMCRPTQRDLDSIAGELGIHELAIEDAIGPHQRPKLDYYQSHLFLACHAVSVNATTAELDITEFDTFIGDRWVITVRKESGFDMGRVYQRCDRISDLASTGVAFVVYALLDVVLDGYFDTVRVFDEYYDTISDGIFNDRPLQDEDQRKWFQMRQALIRFHRLAFPLREAIGSLVRGGHDLEPSIHPYFQDIYDHVLRITESTDSLRDLISTIVETNLSLRDYRQNQVMKKVTSWAAIIAVPTLVTGFYGMNLKFPSVSTTWGTWIAVTIMVVASTTLYVQFKRRDWL